MESIVSAPPGTDFPPRLLSNESLQDSITELAACITVATAQLLVLIAELDRREAWGDWGVKSCAHWLNWKCGIGLGAAREKVRVARALEALPLISAAFAAGEVSYSKVRAMTRVATAATEDYLLMIARHGTASHVEGLVRSYRRMLRNESIAAANDAHAARELNWFWDEDGSFVIEARLQAESGALVLKALEAAVDEINGQALDENVPAETSSDEEPFAARRADALANIAGEYLSGDSNVVRQAERYQVVVHVDSESLRIDSEPGRCDIAEGPALCPETARRIACDASLVAIDFGVDGNPLNIGRKMRTVPSSIRRALELRDRGCRFPGCTSRHYVDAHHIRHWRDGGETSVRNLVSLCRHHHRLVHEGGFQVSLCDDDSLLFFTPDDVWIPTVPEPAVCRSDVAVIAKGSGADVSAETLLPMWHGEKMDMGLAVDGLMRRTILAPG
jgi:hypothetical protein